MGANVGTLFSDPTERMVPTCLLRKQPRAFFVHDETSFDKSRAHHSSDYDSVVLNCRNCYRGSVESRGFKEENRKPA